MATEWFYEKDGEKLGPVSPIRLKELAANGQLEARDLVWKVGMEAWQPAARLRGLFQEGTTPPPVPRSTSDRPSERGAVHETSNPTQTPAAKLRAGIFEAAKRTARKARDVAGSDGVQEMLGRAGRAATVVGIKANDAAQKAKEYATSDEAKEMVSKAKRAASDAGDKVLNSARQAKDYATSDEVKKAVATSRENASDVGSKLIGFAVSILARLGIRWRWTRRKLVFGAAGACLAALVLMVLRGGGTTNSSYRGATPNIRDEVEVTRHDAGHAATASRRTSTQAQRIKDVANENASKLSARAVLGMIDPISIEVVDYSGGPGGEKIIEKESWNEKMKKVSTEHGFIDSTGKFVAQGLQIVWHERPTEKNPGTKCQEWSCYDGKKHGIEIGYYKDGIKAFERTWERGEMVGVVILYYGSSSVNQVSLLGRDSSNVPEATALVFYENGQIKTLQECKGLRKQGDPFGGLRRSGETLEWYPNGLLRSHEIFVDDKLDGDRIEWSERGEKSITDYKGGRVVYSPGRSDKKTFVLKLQQIADDSRAASAGHYMLVWTDNFTKAFGDPDYGQTYPSQNELKNRRPTIETDRLWVYNCSDGKLRINIKYEGLGWFRLCLIDECRLPH